MALITFILTISSFCSAIVYTAEGGSVQNASRLAGSPDGMPSLECAKGCPLYFINDGVCDPACYRSECRMDGSDCQRNGKPLSNTDLECAPGCIYQQIKNGLCEEACRVPECGYDFQDCRDKLPEVLTSDVNVEGLCDPNKCPPFHVGDGICHSPCNTPACKHDGGDCDRQRPVMSFFTTFFT
uniref:Notch domain-containing protein n=1 Tax=Tetraselmis sp. GSL018 TaxID=582737 RepID=A0A061RE86_9CHLO|eukprot:CAMPEP_0177591196 /NCGR_PEP_ID=MMETSP0419_2-20121207/7858_1 /TAXON_ID=582737 /ORGANISM="Tetraselmis sp., Strain GSL018" /LENGTH=182 /DNA_ID=CAMNT_0019081901 /DNA_START=48 /DNA_END=596 /DNA_ORIENTATION=+